MTDDLDPLAEFAASLDGMPLDELRQMINGLHYILDAPNMSQLHEGARERLAVAVERYDRLCKCNAGGLCACGKIGGGPRE